MKLQKLNTLSCMMALGLFASSGISAATLEYITSFNESASGSKLVTATNPAHTYQPGGGNLSGLSQFNPSMGTLNSAELFITGDFSYELQLTASGINGAQTHFVSASVNPSVALIVPAGGGGYTFGPEIIENVPLSCNAVSPACDDGIFSDTEASQLELFTGSELTDAGFIGTGDLSQILLGLLYNVDGYSLQYASDAMLDIVDLNFAGDVSVIYDYSPVPIPAAVWLFGSSLVGLFGIAKRRKAR
ncbi:MAG: hypothetical protein DRR42_25640 [Gammaproteobacteria bacterium]|nr:MAG: hypothetical protein DRR42_25640 [Gammaproteobacteria bacterium]